MQCSEMAGSTYNTEIAEIDEVILRLDLTLVKPDDDDVRGQQQVRGGGAVTSSVTSSAPGQAVTSPGEPSANGVTAAASDKTDDGPALKTSPSVSQTDEDKRKSSKPLDFIRKLRSQTGGGQTDTRHHRANTTQADSSSKRKSPEPFKVYTHYSKHSNQPIIATKLTNN